MTFPSNLKPRELYCPHCKTYTVNNLAGATCEVCHNDLLTVIHSQMDGSRMTGDELVTRNNQTT